MLTAEQLASANVVFITIDSCRADTFERARTPFMRSIGQLMQAETYGTFTLPAHIAFLAGYLPKVVKGPRIDYYSRGAKQLWRLAASRRKAADKVGLMLNGSTIIEGYRNRGYYTLGAGGVRWFRSELLTRYFNEFLFWGCDDSRDVFAPRSPDDFALNHVDDIVGKLHDKNQYFLFLNCQETHVPYDLGYGHDTESIHSLTVAKPLWGGKRPEPGSTGPSADDYARLHYLQVAALEEVDRRLERLMAALPGPKVVLVCADHGEAFGEDGLYGHGFPARAVVEVPLIVGYLDSGS